MAVNKQEIRKWMGRVRQDLIDLEKALKQDDPSLSMDASRNLANNATRVDNLTCEKYASE